MFYKTHAPNLFFRWLKVHSIVFFFFFFFKNHSTAQLLLDICHNMYNKQCTWEIVLLFVCMYVLEIGPNNVCVDTFEFWNVFDV